MSSYWSLDGTRQQDQCSWLSCKLSYQNHHGVTIHGATIYGVTIHGVYVEWYLPNGQITTMVLQLLCVRSCFVICLSGLLLRFFRLEPRRAGRPKSFAWTLYVCWLGWNLRACHPHWRSDFWIRSLGPMRLLLGGNVGGRLGRNLARFEWLPQSEWSCRALLLGEFSWRPQPSFNL